MDQQNYKRPNALKATKTEVDAAIVIDTFVMLAAMSSNPILGNLLVGMYPDPGSINN